MFRKANSLACAVLAIGIASFARAQSFDVPWHTIDSGGGMWTAGGPFELSGTIGQTDAGEMTGGSFTLIGGFWAGVAESPCPADVNGDRQVDLSDLTVLLSHFGMPNGGTLEDGDLDGDGDVDLSDLAAMLSRFGSICA
jgi:hypothetical protein